MDKAPLLDTVNKKRKVKPSDEGGGGKIGSWGDGSTIRVVRAFQTKLPNFDQLIP
jgi:hypothetical protein